MLGENIMVARVTLHSMSQDRDETIRPFGARIKGQASTCKYVTQCSADECGADVDFTEVILRDVLGRGIADLEIQMDLLGDQNQDMSLEGMLSFIKAKESGKRSASRLFDAQGANSMNSTYRRSKMRELNGKCPDPKVGQQERQQLTFSYCGGRGHDKRDPPHMRAKEFPAYNHRCMLCNIDHHTEGLCCSKDKPKPGSKATNAGDQETAAIIEFSALCTIQAIGRRREGPITMDHHLYNSMRNMWMRGPSQAQPYIRLHVMAKEQDYRDLGFELLTPTRPLPLQAIADTGCQSCLAGLQVINSLGLHRHDLIPVTMKMHDTNEKGINILGAAILRFSGTGQPGHLHETRQITYVTDNSDKLFLSRKACEQLGMIPGSFLTIGDVHTCATLNSPR